MNTYLTIFGKPRYLGFMRIDDNKSFDINRPKWAVLRTLRGYEMGLPGGMLDDEQQETTGLRPQAMRTQQKQCFRTWNL